MAGLPARVKIFIVVTAASVGLAVGYTLWAARASKPAPAASSTTRSLPPPPAATAAPAAAATDQSVEEQPAAAPPSGPPASATAHASATPAYLIALNMRDSPELGQVEFARLDTVEARTATGLRCERIYFAAGKGVCLRREIKFYAAETVATFTDDHFRPLFDVRTPGTPTRARISRDGRVAAFTAFVTGHSYADTDLSTTTVLVNLRTRETIANLEEFEVSKDGQRLQALDVNYWGVTFGADSNFFYATLRTGGVNYLVHGDIGRRSVTVMYAGVECPSLSPDETRIAFKKAIGRGDWRLAILDLATYNVVALRETRSVDDQAEWLDNAHVLYAVPDPAPWMTIMVASANGSGEPAVFVKGSASPAVAPHFHP